ncbi:TRAP transporter small permease subunit [Kangiella sediminilitoris]|uniref:TRAP transporter small permease protein n=1 Tax=Kangiella sediminilitoris TaxID=1144748 RepID=A0A1B3B7V3_9GAMM|nr:TRAP transporter small permease subunit [Kangiella sediminilitoris]AOE48857.1 Tripartite ATP-independent periplasmic transporter DctQ component [Kangiella sediminilitoris]
MLKIATLKTLSLFDMITEWIGRLISWLTLFMVLTVILVLALRNWFDLSAIALQESVNYMHATVFMLGAAFALKYNDHVRVDVFYQNFSPRKKAIVNMLGFLLLLLPVCLFIFIYCKDYVLFSWALREDSNQPGGIPFMYIFKSLLLAMPVALIIQGFSDFLKCLAYLCGWTETPPLLESSQHEEANHA